MPQVAPLDLGLTRTQRRSGGAFCVKGPGASELNGSAKQFRPKARWRLHMCRQTSRSYSCVPIIAARVPLLPRRLQPHRNGSYRQHREAANATAQKSVQLRQMYRSSDRPIATLGPRRLQSAGSSLPAVPTVPSLVYIRSLSRFAGGHPFVFQVPEPTFWRSSFLESFSGRMTAAKPLSSADVRCSMISSME